MNKECKTMEAVIEVGDNLNQKVNSTEMVKLINDNGDVDLSKLSETQIAKCNEMTKGLAVTDINSISNYGADLQHAMTSYSNDFLGAVRASQGGEVGELINGLLTELGYVDVDELKAPSAIKKFLRKLPIVGKVVGGVEKVLSKYDSIQNNIKGIEQKIQATRLHALRDNNSLQVMFENNVQYGKQVDELIIAGKLKLKEVNEQLQHMLANQSEYDAHQIQDVQEFSHNLERRLNDMMTLRYVVKQSLPQIRTVQYNNIAIADKAQSIIATTIPVWRNQLSIAVALHNQAANIEAHKKVTETTANIIKKNAEMLKQNSVDVAKANESSVIEIEVLRESTQKLIETINEVKKVHEEGAAKRREAEKNIMELEKQLEQSMSASQSTMKYLR